MAMQKGNMDVSRTGSIFPYPSRVEGFLDCCGEYKKVFFLGLELDGIFAIYNGNSNLNI